MIVFEDEEQATMGTQVVNRLRQAQFGLRTPAEVLPPHVWKDGVPMKLQSSQHCLLPKAISKN